MYRYRTEDMLLVREYMEEHLRMNHRHKSIKPIWCKKCQSLLRYTVILDTKKGSLQFCYINSHHGQINHHPFLLLF